MTVAAGLGLADIERWLELDEDASRKTRRATLETEAKVRALRLTPEQRLGAARGLPPAIVKVVRGGATGGGRALKTQLAYLSREDDLAFKTEYGMVCDGPGDLDRAMASWQVDFDATNWRRKTTHLVISTPRGTDAVTLEAAADRFAEQLFGADGSAGAFGEEWAYLRVAHTDTDYPHVHIVVNNRGRHEGRQFEVHPAKPINPQSLRTLWKEAAAEVGLELDDTPRRARGLPKTQERTPDWRRRQRRETSRFAGERAAETLRRLRDGRPASESEHHATKRARSFVAAERLEYRRIADAYDRAAREIAERSLKDVERADAARRSASILRGFADRLGEPWTRTRDAAARILAAFGSESRPSPSAIERHAREAATGPSVKEPQMTKAAPTSDAREKKRDVERAKPKPTAARDQSAPKVAAAAPTATTPSEARARLAALSSEDRTALARVDAEAERRVDAAYRAASRIYVHVEQAARARADAEKRRRQELETRSKRRDDGRNPSPKRRR